MACVGRVASTVPRFLRSLNSPPSNPVSDSSEPPWRRRWNLSSATPGVNRPMFFEVTSTPPPAALVAQLDVPRHWFTQMIRHASDGSLNRQAAHRIGNIVHSYAHGVIGKPVHGRTVVCDRGCSSGDRRQHRTELLVPRRGADRDAAIRATEVGRWRLS